jgi:hypothetical protein
MMGNKKALQYLQGFGDLAGTRTQDPYIKSVLLYQLSYQIDSFISFATIPITIGT